MDITSIGGLVFAIVCILGGQAIEGGHAGSLAQATAAIIVIGGTIAGPAGAAVGAKVGSDASNVVQGVGKALKNIFGK